MELSITSSWGNGHATTYRGLVRELCAELYAAPEDLERRFRVAVEEADLVIVGSFVPDGIRVGEWALSVARGPVAFYDIDTPVTLAALARGDCAYLDAGQIPRYSLYLSFTGGPTLKRLEREFGSPRAIPVYCSFDPEAYYPEHEARAWELGYLGTYSPGRMPPL